VVSKLSKLIPMRLVPAVIALLGFAAILVASVVIAPLMWLHLLPTLTGQDPAETVEDAGPVYCVAVSDDGRRILSGHQDSRARVWDVNSGELLAAFGSQRPAVVCAAFAPGGRTAAYAYADEVVRIWDFGAAQEVKTLRGHTERIITVAYLPGGKQLLSASADQTIRLWDVDSGAELRCFRGHGADVNSVAVFADGRRFISAGGDYWGGRENDPSLRLWDLASGRQLAKFEGRVGPLRRVALSPDNRMAVTCNWDTRIQVWDVKTGREIRCFGDTYTNRVAISPDGRRVVSGGYSGELKVWSVESGEMLTQLAGHASQVHDLVFCPDGNHIVSCSGHWGSRGGPLKRDFLGEPLAEAVDCTVRLWDLTTGKEIRRFNSRLRP
jgi:WD40 repeat protein